MADARLRQLQRSADSPEGEARLLRERVRAGELIQAHVEAAAYLGHEGARLVVGEECSCGLGPDDATDLCRDEALSTWVDDMPGMLRPLPRVGTVERECGGPGCQGGTVWPANTTSNRTSIGCLRCNGTGTVTGYAPEHYGMARAAVVVGWEAHRGCLCHGYSRAYMCMVRKALDRRQGLGGVPV